MVELSDDRCTEPKKVAFEAAVLVALVITCPGDPNSKLHRPLVEHDGEIMEAWLNLHGFRTETLTHQAATKEAITDWFKEQTIACIRLS